jgi:hypothetical protein
VAGTATAAPTLDPTRTPLPVETPTASATPDATPPAADPAVAAAHNALARWLGPAGDPSSIETRSVEAVTWPDGCLGIARVGIACTDALVPGYRIMLGLWEASYEVRTDESGSQTAWAPQTEILVRFAESSTNVAAFSTDDGNRLETRLVPGTEFGLDLLGLEAGTPVGIAIADAPQGGAPLLVWVDPAFQE